MIKYLGHSVTFQEIPDESTLCFNITNCQHKCIGCHSPELQQDNGEDLEQNLSSIIDQYIGGITCVCFMGEGNDPDALIRCMHIICNDFPKLKIALYTGLDSIDDVIKYLAGYTMKRSNNMALIDYLKTGKYIPEKGGLDHRLTNQRMYRADNDAGYYLCYDDITSLFWKDKNKTASISPATTSTQKG